MQKNCTCNLCSNNIPKKIIFKFPNNKKRIYKTIYSFYNFKYLKKSNNLICKVFKKTLQKNYLLNLHLEVYLIFLSNLKSKKKFIFEYKSNIELQKNIFNLICKVLHNKKIKHNCKTFNLFLNKLLKKERMLPFNITLNPFISNFFTH